VTWVNAKATEAIRAHDYDEALEFLTRSVQMRNSPENRSFAYNDMAQIYGFQRKAKPYREALENLAILDPSAKNSIIDKYGPPDEIEARQKE